MAHDPVNHPKHYTSHPSGIECIEVTRHMNFNLGNAVKYLWRAGLKDSAPSLQDLQKAAWYINDEIMEMRKQADKARLQELERPILDKINEKGNALLRKGINQETLRHED